MDLNRSRQLGYQALERHDREQELTPRPDRRVSGGSAPWPKDDRRSSSRIGERPERME